MIKCVIHIVLKEMDGTSKYEKHESKENYKRRTKALKNKETFEKNGKMSSKHLRIQEALKSSKNIKEY